MALDLRGVALAVVAVIAAIAALRYAQSVFIPVILAVLISYALEPLVRALTRIRVVRPIAAALVIALVLGGTGAMLYGLRYQANAIVEQLPDAARRLRRVVETDGRQTTETLQQVQRAASELEKTADAAAPAPPSGVTRVQVEPAPVQVGQYVMSGSLGIAAAAGQMVMVVFLAYFMLASGNLYRRKFVKIAGPSLTRKKITVQILEEIDRQIERFLIVQLLSSALVGVVTWLVFLWLGLQQAAIWGIFAGVFNSIPYFGPVIVTGTTAVIAFLQFGSIRMAVTTGAAALVITTLEGWLLTPWLTSRAARMNAVAVFLGLLFFGWLWEVWGLLLAVPMLMVVKAVCDRIDDFKNIGELLGE